MSEGLSRRNFLKGAALTGAALAGSAALAGCASGGSGSSSAAAADWMPASWDYETDVVVVGYGGAGMWASLIAADEGGSEVVVLEKAPVEGGGNSRINNGEWTVIKDPKLFREYCVAFGHGLIEEDMIDAYIAEATQHTDYADKYGMTYEVAEQALAGTIPEYWFLDDGKYAGCIGVSSVEGFGMTTFHELEAKRAELGLPIELKFDCSEEHLIQNPENKEIVGVKFLEAGAEKTIKARKGVVLCTGGFEFNEELKNTYLSIYPFKFEGWRFNTGDGIRMVEEVGAKLWHMNMVISTTAMWTRDPEYDFAIFAGPQSNAFFTVNRLGKRYQNENKTGGTAHNGWHTLMSFNDAIDDYDRIPSWQIFDQKGIDGGPMGTQQGGWFECGNYTTDLPDELRDWDGWSDDNQVEIERGWVLKGDTLEDLAKKIQEFDHWMDYDNLKATFDEYQAACDAGMDPRFDRELNAEEDKLTPEGPYYAISIYPGSCSTLGGPKKNANAQVLDPAGNVIPRLYAAGSFGNFQAHSYGITGGNNSENMVWGRIGGRHCAGLEPWDKEEKKKASLSVPQRNEPHDRPRLVRGRAGVGFGGWRLCASAEGRFAPWGLRLPKTRPIMLAGQAMSGRPSRRPDVRVRKIFHDERDNETEKQRVGFGRHRRLRLCADACTRHGGGLRPPSGRAQVRRGYPRQGGSHGHAGGRLVHGVRLCDVPHDRSGKHDRCEMSPGFGTCRSDLRAVPHGRSGAFQDP